MIRPRSIRARPTRALQSSTASGAGVANDARIGLRSGRRLEIWAMTELDRLALQPCRQWRAGCLPGDRARNGDPACQVLPVGSPPYPRPGHGAIHLHQCDLPAIAGQGPSPIPHSALAFPPKGMIPRPGTSRSMCPLGDPGALRRTDDESRVGQDNQVRHHDGVRDRSP